MNNHLGNMCFNYFYINVHVKNFSILILPKKIISIYIYYEILSNKPIRNFIRKIGIIKIFSITYIIMAEKSLGDNPYNAVHQLTKTLEFLNRVNTYIEDAQKANNDKFVKIWETIKADRQKHADLLKEFLSTEVKENRF